jgi:hypothetical protein
MSGLLTRFAPSSGRRLIERSDVPPVNNPAELADVLFDPFRTGEPRRVERPI